MRLRVVDTGLAPARWNIAASAALLASVDEGGDATLRFHRFHPSCILGRFQDVEAELDPAGCRVAGVEIARRMTGGGAVVMGPGILAFDLVLPCRGGAMSDLPEKVGAALLATLAACGLAATRPTVGSVAIGGLKVSGSAGRLARRAMLHQATLILDLATAPPLSLLRRRTEGGKPTPDPRHRVTDLRTALVTLPPPHAEVLAIGEPRSTQHGVASFEASLREAPQDEEVAENVRRHLISRLADTFELQPESDAMSNDEHARVAAILADTVGRDDFVLTGDVERRAA